MCRWLAYSGPPIFLDALLVAPANALVRQSLNAHESIQPTNGDGFGIGWYGARPEPGLFRDILPAWNDENLLDLARQTRAGLFFAHVRASTGTATARANCHPFRHGRWLFMHNGRIGGWEDARRPLEADLDATHFRVRRGTTDSEVMFLLALTLGLERDPEAAMAAALARVLERMDATGTEEPLRVTATLSDGETLWAWRFSSDGQSPTLYHGTGRQFQEASAEQGSAAEIPAAAHDGVLVLSEPLDDDKGAWTPVPDGSLLVASRGKVEISPFAPR